MTNKVTRTAPKRIWLQVSDDARDACNEFPEPSMELTWCADSVIACEVEYVRADLVRAAMPKNWHERMKEMQNKLLCATCTEVDDG